MHENTFGAITQHHIRATFPKNKTRVLELLIFNETRADNTKKSFRVLSCVMCTIIKNYVCIDYLSFQ